MNRSERLAQLRTRSDFLGAQSVLLITREPPPPPPPAPLAPLEPSLPPLPPSAL